MQLLAALCCALALTGVADTLKYRENLFKLKESSSDTLKHGHRLGKGLVRFTENTTHKRRLYRRFDPDDNAVRPYLILYNEFYQSMKPFIDVSVGRVVAVVDPLQSPDHAKRLVAKIGPKCSSEPEPIRIVESCINYEAKFTSAVSSDFVIKILDTVDNNLGNKRMAIIMEESNGRDLFEWILELDHFDQHMAGHVFAQMALAIQAVHHAGIAHNDIKPENFVVHVSGSGDSFPWTRESLLRTTIKLIDFGGATLANVPFTELPQERGTIGYIAPEKFNEALRGPADPKPLDVYALGVSLAFMMRPHAYPIGENLAFKFLPIQWKKLSYPDSVKEILCGTLENDPSKRWTIDQVVEHSFVQDYWNQIQQQQQESHEQDHVQTGPSSPERTDSAVHVPMTSKKQMKPKVAAKSS